MNDRWPQPLLIDAKNKPCPAEAVPVGSPPFSEAELQAILRSIRPCCRWPSLTNSFGPPICIGREVATDAGPIDLVCISPSGHLTLIETKLWKSPEARRQVVAQIIHYMRHVVRWNYESLQKRFLTHARQAGLRHNSLYEYVCTQAGRKVDETDFIDNVSRCLHQGRMLLLIVGDGIREGVEDMASILQETPSMQFTLGLVEIGCYRVTHAEEACLLLVPRVVAKTAEITRAIVQIEMSEEAAAKVVMNVKTPSETVTRRPTSLSEREFYEHLAKDQDAELADMTREFVVGLLEAHDTLDQHITLHSLKIRLELPVAESNPLAVLVISWHGNIQISPRILESLADSQLHCEIKDRFLKRVAAIDARMVPEQRADGTYLRTKGGPRNLPDVAARFVHLAEAISSLVEDVQRAAEES